ncbi:phosphonate C-P lyase system protein PhnG [Leisingera methylohalidivorans]|uniref:phosphonate C-P lyase system protein PhnG n=1 Tax=Leisingera methylohalidivorans TaxID=133924 RepID=UPI00316AE6FF
MGLLSPAEEARLAELRQDCGAGPVGEWPRAPEAGGVTMRGRMGGSGAPFSLGEMQVSTVRCR